jgi:hypothetical protein
LESEGAEPRPSTSRSLRSLQVSGSKADEYKQPQARHSTAQHSGTHTHARTERCADTRDWRVTCHGIWRSDSPPQHHTTPHHTLLTHTTQQKKKKQAASRTAQGKTCAAANEWKCVMSCRNRPISCLSETRCARTWYVVLANLPTNRSYSFT